MIELFVLLIALGAIGTFARGKKISPQFAVGSAFAGWLMIEVMGVLTRSSDEGILFMLSAWIWLALVAGYLRFIVGAGLPKPDMQWNCSNCHYLNSASSLFCEACEQAWPAPRSSLGKS